VRRGLAALDRAEALQRPPRTYQLQAAIAACHARARRAADTDWGRIAELYDQLAAFAPSPIVELNRAVAYGMAFGAEAGLEIVDQLVDDPTLENYHLLPSVRGDFLFKLGRTKDARAEFERAAGMTRNEREKAFLLERAAASGEAN
jgi:predicted RNA polymerase sigma factor